MVPPAEPAAQLDAFETKHFLQCLGSPWQFLSWDYVSFLFPFARFFIGTGILALFTYTVLCVLNVFARKMGPEPEGNAELKDMLCPFLLFLTQGSTGRGEKKGGLE